MYQKRKLRALALNTSPGDAATVKKPLWLLQLAARLRPGVVSRAGFWAWKKSLPPASGPLLTPKEVAENKADFMRISPWVAVGQIGEIIDAPPLYRGEYWGRIATITYVIAQGGGEMDPFVKGHEAMAAWQKTVPVARFHVHIMDNWAPGWHCPIGYYDSYARLLTELATS